MSSTPLLTNSFVSAYLEQCKTLVKTMTIKSGVSAESINDSLTLKYGSAAVDPELPETWKYYMNISGEYHPTDTTMRVVSLDNLQEIDFTKENLALHTATKEAYAYGTRYYYSLLNQYPNQDQLIIGILYPVDKTTAINATEGTILGWPSYLVESQEQSLMRELEEYIKLFIHRWVVKAFAITDSLYNTSYHVMLYLSLGPKLLNLRLKRCHTPEVHSFHVRQYLASHKYLNKYLPYLTLDQALYFYQNINYLMRNVGSTKNFDTLLKKILTDRRIPMSEYSIRQLNTFDEKLYPEITARRKPINDEFNVAEVSYIPVSDLFSKENDMAYGNGVYYDANSTDTLKAFQNSPSSVVQTKDLESNMVDYSDAIPDPLNRVLMRQWAYMSTHDLYNVSVNFKDPKTGENRTLYAQDALIYYLYISFTSVGHNVTKIPPYVNWKARNNPKPTLQQLLSVVDKKFVDLHDMAQQILDGQPDLVECVSIKQFYDVTYKIYQEAYKHWFLTSSVGDLEKRGMVEGMILRLYHDEEIYFKASETMTMSEWLVSVNMPTYNYTYDQAKELMSNIFLAATGLVLDDTKQLKNIQENLVSMMMELSSYSIQTIVEINDSAVIPLNWPAVRPGNFQVSTADNEYLPISVRVNDALVEVKQNEEINLTGGRIQGIAEAMQFQEAFVSIGANTVLNTKTEITYGVNVPALDISVTYDGHPQGYSGIDIFNSLSDDQKRQLMSADF